MTLVYIGWKQSLKDDKTYSQLVSKLTFGCVAGILSGGVVGITSPVLCLTVLLGTGIYGINKLKEL